MNPAEHAVERVTMAELAVQALSQEYERLKTRVGWLDHLDTPEGRAMHATEAVKVENEELRAEVERLRNHISSSETASCVELGALRLSLKQVDADVDALRADLREAMELLRAHGQAPSWMSWVGKFGAEKDWDRRYGELLAKYKEAT